MIAHLVRPAMLFAATVALGACTAYDGWGGSRVSVGYSSGGYYPYGYSRYGSYYGWYDGFYYPGIGYYIYDSYGRRHRWSDRHRRYWEGRRGGWRDRSANWGDYRRGNDGRYYDGDRRRGDGRDWDRRGNRGDRDWGRRGNRDDDNDRRGWRDNRGERGDRGDRRGWRGNRGDDNSVSRERPQSRSESRGDRAPRSERSSRGERSSRSVDRGREFRGGDRRGRTQER